MIQLKLTPRKPRENSRQYVFRMMYENIMSFQLPPGTATSEQDVSTLLNISRTPVRDAFVRLSQMQLLDIVPQRKTKISRIHTERLEDSCFMRQAVESAVMSEVCTNCPPVYQKRLHNNLERQKEAIINSDNSMLFRLDEVLHKTIFDACGRSFVWDYLTQSDYNYLRARVLSTLSAISQMEIVYQQHLDIVEAIQNHDTRKGRRLISTHVVRILSLLDNLRKTYPDYFA